MSAGTDLYYSARPLIPRAVQIAVRRLVIRCRRRLHQNEWPIDERAKTPPDGWPGWPDGKRFGLVLTHDVESAAGLMQCRQVIDMEARFGLCSSFNLVPERYAVPPSVRESIMQAGCEIGVHGLKHDGRLYRSRSMFNSRAARINGYLKEWGAAGFRSPAMHHNLDWLHALDVLYDASTFDVDPFEPQPDGVTTIFPFWVPDGRGGGYAELPYTLPQDSSLFIMMHERTIEMWKRKLDWIVEQGGMALVIVHPDYMDFERDTARGERYPAAWYEAFLKYVTTRYAGAYWHGLPRDLATYVRKTMGSSRSVRASETSSSPSTLTCGKPSRRVCVLRHGYYPGDVRVSKEVQALTEAGYEVDVICLRYGKESYIERNGTVTITRLPYGHKHGSTGRYMLQYGLSMVLMMLVLSWRALFHRYACVQVNTMPDALVFAAWLPRWRGARVLLDMHEPMPELYVTKYGEERRRLFFRLQVVLEQAAIRFADRVITVNETIRRRFIERGATAEKIGVVRNVPGEAFLEIERPREDRDTFTLMTHGTLQPRYGHEVLLRALPRLREAIPNVRLIIMGQGDTEAALRDLARRLDCGDIVAFEGLVPFAEVSSALIRADVGLVPLLPSAFSDLCQPNKLFEYVALKIPVVVARFPAIEETFDETCVAYFKPGDPEDLARRVLAIYEMPDRGSGLADNAYRRYDKVRWDVAKKIYVQSVCEWVRGQA